MTDPLEESLIELGLSIVGWSTKYDCVTLHARSYTKQKYRKKYYSWLQVGKELKGGVFEEGSFSTWPKHLLKSKTNQKNQAEREAMKHFSVYHINKYRTLCTEQEEIPVKHRQKKSQATTPDS